LHKTPLIALALALAMVAASPARAAPSYDNCSGFIDSLPATITTQGVWCLRADLATAISSGLAIQVDANNVTIDCNHFRLGGLGGGTGSAAIGVWSVSPNTVVRNCNIRGFRTGIFIESMGGNLVDSNRLDGNLRQGVYVAGPGSVIRGNLVIATGGSTAATAYAAGITAVSGTDVIGNTIVGVQALGETTRTYGIVTNIANGASVRDNLIKGVVSNGDEGLSAGIMNFQSRQIAIRGNDIQGVGAINSTAISCSEENGTTGGNFITGYASAVSGCTSFGDTINPN